jgi:hypothetical protein
LPRDSTGDEFWRRSPPTSSPRSVTIAGRNINSRNKNGLLSRHRLGFEPEYYPLGFAILRRDEIEIFLQQQPRYVAPDDPGRREREAWNVYIVTDDVKALYEEYSSLRGVEISRPLCPQEYGMTEFDVMDLNGYRLVFAEPTPTK